MILLINALLFKVIFCLCPTNFFLLDLFLCVFLSLHQCPFCDSPFGTVNQLSSPKSSISTSSSLLFSLNLSYLCSLVLRSAYSSVLLAAQRHLNLQPPFRKTLSWTPSLFSHSFYPTLSSLPPSFKQFSTVFCLMCLLAICHTVGAS